MPRKINDGKLIKRESMKAAFLIAMSVVSLGVSTNGYSAEPSPETPKPAPASHTSYIPHTGEIMGLEQMRHSKLWFAGNASNWDLADYELGEIKEGLDDVVKYHPVFKNGAQIALMLGKFMDRPMEETRKAIAAKDSAGFAQAFGDLTAACNACHRAAGRGYVRIVRPDTSPYTNQEFAPK